MIKKIANPGFSEKFKSNLIVLVAFLHRHLLVFYKSIGKVDLEITNNTEVYKRKLRFHSTASFKQDMFLQRMIKLLTNDNFSVQ